MNNYKDLKIWKKGMDVVQKTYQLAKQLDDKEKYTLRPQLIRSAISIPSNIAEGTCRKSNKDFARFLEIALGSCFELETQLSIVQSNNLAPNIEFDKLFRLIQEIQKMINSFIRKLIIAKELEAKNQQPATD
ncbi:MAG: four helix bundle protein [Bacteroidales bacterium]|nr:four helix bundle protein [Bacteroidales bacterium]